jgi:tetratricopeptide (TPR) repeat protein
MNFEQVSKIATPQALRKFLDRHYDGSIEKFYLALNAESDRLIRTDLKQALRLSEWTSGLDALLPDKYRAQMYRIWGRHAHLSGDYPGALKLYNRAIGLFAAVGDRNSKARVQKALLDVLAYLGKYDEAAEVGRQSLRFYGRINATTDYAQVLTNLGNLYHRLDENRKALRYYDRAYEIFKNLDNTYALALVQFNRGNIYSNLNELDKSERLYRQAGKIYRSLSMDLAATQADYSLAYIEFLKGNYSESLDAFARVGEEFRRLGDQRCLALTELDRAEVYLHLNLYSQAIDDALAVADQFGRLKMSYEQGKAYYFAAAGYFAFGDLTLAGKLARRALKIFVHENNRVWQVLCRFLLAKIDFRDDRVKKALNTFREIAHFYKRHGDIRQYTDVRLTWLEVLIYSKQHRAAIRLLAGIGEVHKDLTGYQRFLYCLLVGDLNRDRGDTNIAARFYRRAIGEAEKLQETIFPDEIRRFFWIDKLAAYNRLTAIYLEKGRPRQAFRIVEKGKVALAMTADLRLPDGRQVPLPPSLEAERTRLKAYLRKAIIPAGTMSRSVTAARRVQSAERRLWKISQTMRDRRRISAGHHFEAFRGMNDIQNSLHDGDMVVQYVLGEKLCGAFVIDANGFAYRPLDINVKELRGLLARFYFLINSVSTRDVDRFILDDLLRRISDKIWKPLETDFDHVINVYLVPDGILARLPFSIVHGWFPLIRTVQSIHLSVLIDTGRSVVIRTTGETVHECLHPDGGIRRSARYSGGAGGGVSSFCRGRHLHREECHRG